MNLVLNGKATVADVARLKQEIQSSGKTGNTLRLSRCHGMTMEVVSAIIELLTTTPKQLWQALVVEDCCKWIQLEQLMDTIHKLDIFQSISYSSSSICLCGGERIHLDEQRRLSYRAPYILASFTPFQPHSLQELKLSGETLGQHAATSLRLALHGSTSLATLKLSFREYEKDAFHRILLGIEANKSIQTLDMSRNRLWEPSTLAIIKSVTAHPTVSCLDLSGNKVGASGLRALAEALAFPACKISELHMSQCYLADMSPFFNGLKSNSSLQTLCLTENRHLISITAILENMYKLRCIEKLGISRCFNRVTPEDIASLSSYCFFSANKPQNLHLRSLVLSMNNFGDSGLDALLCFCAAQFPALESLTLVSTKFSLLSLPNFLSFDKEAPTLPKLRKLAFGTLGSDMMQGVSKIVDRLPAVYTVGITSRVEHLEQWKEIQSRLDRRRFPVTGDIRPLSLWPIIFGNVNEYFSTDRYNKRCAEFLHELVQGPGMPLLRIALEGGHQ